MELRHLKAFLTVAEELHFGRAAARLNMAQPPLSQQIRQLERECRAQLFERSTRSVRLTAAGTALLEPARRVLAEADRAQRAVRAAGAGETGQVSIGFAGAMGNAVLPRLARAVRSAHPGIELVLRGQTYSGEALGQVMDGELDLGFVHAPNRPGIAGRVVRYERLLVALPVGHPLALLPEIEPADLADEAFVSAPAARGSAVREALDRVFARAGAVPRVVQEAPDSYTLLTLVGAEVGVALVVSSAESVRVDHVVYRPLAEPVDPLPISLVWREGNTAPAVRAVLETAEAVLPTPPPHPPRPLATETAATAPIETDSVTAVG